MGYCTAYSLKFSCDRERYNEVFDGVVNLLKELNIIDYALDECLDCCETVKWYEHDKDMLKVSLAFPDIVFTLSGEGEEAGDLWRKYYKNGKIQEAPAKIIYDDFDENKLR